LPHAATGKVMTQKQDIQSYVTPEWPATPEPPVLSVLEPFSVDAASRFSPIEEIRSFHRFHFRLTIMYGGAVMLTMATLVYLFYSLWSASEIEALQRRLSAISSSLAQTIEADKIATFALYVTGLSPRHEELRQPSTHLAQTDCDVESIYILRPSNVPAELYFFIDFAKGEKQGAPGQFYSAEDTPILL